MKHLFFALLIYVCNSSSYAQIGVLLGQVKDAHSDEPILFASIKLMKTGTGKKADSIGQFVLKMVKNEADSIMVSSVGYKTTIVPIPNTNKDTVKLLVLMDRAKTTEGVTVRSKVGKGQILWRKIVKNKDRNDRFKFNQFSYDLYNKLELDIVNLNREKLREIKMFKPFGFVLDNIDSTSEVKPFLPIYITETFSKYYLQNQPRKTREEITATRTSGIENESVSKLMGGMYSNVNFYNNFIPVFNTDFVSPFSENGSSYYNYRVVDTQTIQNHRCFKLIFTPFKPGYNTFVGDCWVADSSYAVVNVAMALDKGANINYIEKITIVQECKKIDGRWLLHKEKFVVNVAPVGKNKLTITGRKTTNYANILINDPNILAVLAKNKTKEDIVLAENASKKSDLFWQAQRPEQLSKNEASIYALADTLSNMPLFKRYTKTINFLTTGTKWVGNYEIGPWYNWISGNSVEGTRCRFDLGTNPKFNKHIYLHSYLAYGTRDKKYKGKAEALWILKREPRTWLYASWQQDYDNGQTYYDEVSQDNIFALAIRKPNVPVKFLYIKDRRIEAFRELGNGFSVQIGWVQKQYKPVRNLPMIGIYPTSHPDYKPLNNVETFVKMRFAYLERFLDGNYYRTSLGSPLPIVEMKWSKGYKGFLGSAYKYDKLNMSISDFIKTPPYGNVYYNVFAGKVFGTLPFVLLENHPGNEIFYYNKYAFNMMNRFEYISDTYAGINVEHNFGSGIFKYLPVTRKMKLRQFWNAKMLWGKLSEENKALNIKPGNAFKSLQDQSYIELGTGVDNILKVLRIDCVWRVAPKPLPAVPFQRFAVFGSFRVAF